MSSGLNTRMLLEPVTADSPCGEDLEDTPLLASFDSFRVFGQSAPIDPPPEWGDIKNKALEALAKSKDLRLLAHLGSAVLRTDGLPAFCDTLNVASQWLETYWAQTYPLVVEDVILRRNALNCFADQMAVIDGVRRAPLVSSRQHGVFSLRDIDIATGQIAPRDGEARPGEDQINAAFTAMPLQELTQLHESVAAGVAAIKDIDARMREAAGSEATPAFDSLTTQLAKVDRVLVTQLAARPDSAIAAAVAGDAAPSSTVGAIGVIKSRQDAIRALDAVADFFRHTEPSSPIPMFLTRAKRLVAKDFLDVLADIAPDAVAQARAAGGLREGE
jgi:type VI secretion system protein ImpA